MTARPSRVTPQLAHAVGRLSVLAIGGSAVLALARGDVAQFITLSVLTAGALVVVPFNVAPAFECALLLVLAVQAVARLLGLPVEVTHWDAGAHFVTSAAATPVAYLMLTRIGLTFDPRKLRGPALAFGLLLIAGGCGLSLGAAWELFEWAADETVGTNYSIGYADTITDLVADVLGSAAGAVGLLLYGLRGGS